jgi:hypothetical protein
VALFSETNLKPHKRFYINEKIITQKEKVEWPLKLAKESPTDRWIYFLVSIEASGICIPIGNCEVLLAAV